MFEKTKKKHESRYEDWAPIVKAVIILLSIPYAIWYASRQQGQMRGAIKMKSALSFKNGKINSIGFFEGECSIKRLYPNDWSENNFHLCMKGQEDPFYFGVMTTKYIVHPWELYWCAVTSGLELDEDTMSKITKFLPIMPSQSVNQQVGSEENTDVEQRSLKMDL